MEPHYIGGLDIGGTKMAAMVADADNVLARVTQATVKSGSIRAVGEQAVALVEAACAQAGVPPGMLHMLGVSSCGPFSRIDGMLGLATPNICGGRAESADLPNSWDVIPLESILRERFNTVVIENDCLAALTAERAFGAARGARDCVYVTW